MILSCPDCATQYTVNEALLGPRGRTVRCVACKSTWHAEIPIDLRYSDKEKGQEEIEAVEEPLHKVKAKKLPGKYRAMLEDKKRMKALAVEGLIWGGLAAVALVVLGLGYMLRVDVVRAFPRIAGAYAMVGLKVNPTNLEFGTHTADAAMKGGRFVVTVKAQVKNLSDKPMPVPPVRVKLLDATLQEFASVLMPSNGLVVEPHATKTLVFDVPDARNMTASLDLDFDLIAMKAQKDRKSHTGASPSEHGAEAGSEAGADPHEAPARPPAHGEEHAGLDDTAAMEADLDQDGATETTLAQNNNEAHNNEAQNNEAQNNEPLATHPSHDLRPALSTDAPHAKGHS